MAPPGPATCLKGDALWAMRQWACFHTTRSSSWLTASSQIAFAHSRIGPTAHSVPGSYLASSSLAKVDLPLISPLTEQANPRMALRVVLGVP